MRKIYELGKKLFPINRSITGKGLRKTLKLLKEEVDLIKIKHVGSGTKVYDWQVPKEWNVNKAFVLDKYKRKIIDFKKNNLHLVGYSSPVKRKVSKKELFDHLHTQKNQSNAIPYVTSYYNDHWGFCISENEKTKIQKRYKKNDKFFVFIDSNFNKKGKLSYGEVYLPGKLKKEILISTYICHPSMANNELSGPLVALKLIKFFLKNKIDISLRFLFLPETIGSISYIYKNFKKLRKNVIGGYVLTCIGDNRGYSYLKSKYGNSISDKAAVVAFKKLKIKPKFYSFLERGADERQYNSPKIDLGIGSIMRSKYGTYPEYHTSLDNFDLVTPAGLRGGFKIAKQAILNLMKTYKPNKKKEKTKKKNQVFPITKFICEPNMGKRNLYPKISKKDAKYSKTKNLMDFIQYSDESNSLDQIAKYIKVSKKKNIKIFKFLKRKKLVS